MNARDKILADAANHHSTYVAYAFSILKSWPSAEDVVQEAYVAIAENWSRFNESKGSLFSWVRSIVRNKSFTYMSANKKELPCPWLEIVSLIDDELENVFDSSAEENLKRKIGELSQCFQSLKPRSRNLLYEHYVRGKKYKDIAKAEGLHSHSPANYLYRLRSQLRDCMHKQSIASENRISESEDELLGAFFTGELSEDKMETVTNLLQNEPGKLSVFAQYALESAVFALTLKKMNDKGNDARSVATMPKPLSQDPKMTTFERPIKEESSFRIIHGIGIAAILCLSIGVWQFIARSGNEGAIAEIVFTQGNIFVKTRDGIHVKAKSDQLFRAGEEISVSENGRCGIQYLGEYTTLKVAGNSTVRFIDDSKYDGKQLYLERGEIIANVAKQLTQAPFVIKTPHAEVTILGTKFKLSASSKNTSLFLETGSVSMLNKISHKSEILTSGQYANVQGAQFEIGTIPDEEKVKPSAVQVRENKTDGLLCYFNFDNSQGSLIADSFRFGLEGNIPLSIDLLKCWKEGRFGNAFYPIEVDGSGEVGGNVEISGFPYSEVDKSISISMWLKPIANAAGKMQENASRAIVRYRNDKLLEGWIIRLSRNVKGLQFEFGPDILDKNSYHQNTVKTSLDLEKWSHLAVTYDSGHVTLYHNGNIAMSKDIAGEVHFRASEKHRLRFSPIRRGLHAMIDEFAIFSRTISAVEVEEMQSVPLAQMK